MQWLGPMRRIYLFILVIFFGCFSWIPFSEAREDCELQIENGSEAAPCVVASNQENGICTLQNILDSTRRCGVGEEKFENSQAKMYDTKLILFSQGADGHRAIETTIKDTLTYVQREGFHTILFGGQLFYHPDAIKKNEDLDWAAWGGCAWSKAVQKEVFGGDVAGTVFYDYSERDPDDRECEEPNVGRYWGTTDVGRNGSITYISECDGCYHTNSQEQAHDRFLGEIQSVIEGPVGVGGSDARNKAVRAIKGLSSGKMIRYPWVEAVLNDDLDSGIVPFFSTLGWQQFWKPALSHPDTIRGGYAAPIVVKKPFQIYLENFSRLDLRYITFDCQVASNESCLVVRGHGHLYFRGVKMIAGSKFQSFIRIEDDQPNLQPYLHFEAGLQQPGLRFDLDSSENASNTPDAYFTVSIYDVDSLLKEAVKSERGVFGLELSRLFDSKAIVKTDSEGWDCIMTTDGSGCLLKDWETLGPSADTPAPMIALELIDDHYIYRSWDQKIGQPMAVQPNGYYFWNGISLRIIDSKLIGALAQMFKPALRQLTVTLPPPPLSQPTPEEACVAAGKVWRGDSATCTCPEREEDVGGVCTRPSPPPERECQGELEMDANGICREVENTIGKEVGDQREEEADADLGDPDAVGADADDDPVDEDAEDGAKVLSGGDCNCQMGQPVGPVGMQQGLFGLLILLGLVGVRIHISPSPQPSPIKGEGVH